MPKKKINFMQDVSSPKQRVPSATSKNIIVSSQPIVKDQDIKEEPDKKLGDFTQSHKLVIQPLSDEASLKSDELLPDSALHLDQVPKKDDLLTVQSQDTTPAVINLTDNDQPENKTTKPQASLDLSSQINQLKSETVIDKKLPIDSKTEDLTNEEKITNEDDSRDKSSVDQIYQKTLEDLINSKTYFLPIKVYQQNRKVLVITFLSLIIIVFLWLEIALYYRLITFVGFKSLF